MSRFLVLVALAAVLPACASRAAPALPPGAHHDGRDALRRDLQALFVDPTVQHAHWGISFVSLRTGETLYALNGGRLMIPASAQKLLTTALAAERLGWDYRFTTRLLATAPIGDDGTIAGDVIVVSNGDPSINPRHPARWRAFDDWAAALRAKGVKIINGTLVGDDNAFAEPGWGTGWAWDDLQFGYGAPPTALQYNENQVEVIVGAGMSPGARAIISTAPLGSGLVIDHDVTTADAGTDTVIEIGRVPGSTYLNVRGRIAVDAKPVSIRAAVENPTRFYLAGLREALGRNGIFVGGGIADADDLRTPPAQDGLLELIVDESPPLVELLDVMMKWSRNIYAETFLLATAEDGQPATAAGGLQQLRETMRTWGIAPEHYLSRDGSGLSRQNYVTADMLTWLLTHAWRDPAHAEQFRSTLPVAGVSGTLADRMIGTAAEGRVYAKTGTMSNVRALAGYVTTSEGEPIAFAMLANNYRVSTARVDRIIDAALQRVVEFRR